MFNLLVKYSGWAESRDSIPIGRMLEYTDQTLVDRFRPSGRIDYDALIRLPAVFMEEGNRADQIVRIGSVFRATPAGQDIALEYVADPSIPPVTNEDLEALATDLGIADWEFSRTHWAVKDTDLFRALVRHIPSSAQTASVYDFRPREDRAFVGIGDDAVSPGVRRGIPPASRDC